VVGKSGVSSAILPPLPLGTFTYFCSIWRRTIESIDHRLAMVPAASLSPLTPPANAHVIATTNRSSAAVPALQRRQMMVLPLPTALAVVLGAVPPAAVARPTTNQAVDDATSPFIQGKPPTSCPTLPLPPKC